MPPTTWILIGLGLLLGVAVGLITPALIRWGLTDKTVHINPALSVTLAAAVGSVTPLVIGPAWTLPAWWWFGFGSVALALADISRHRLPDRLVAPFGIGAFAWLTVASVVSGFFTNSPDDSLPVKDLNDLLRAVIAAIAVGAAFLILALVRPGGLGMGDVKLSPIIGLYLGWIGWAAVFFGVFAGFVLGALVALASMGLTTGPLKERMAQHIPFGPAMLLGVAIAASVTIGV